MFYVHIEYLLLITNKSVPSNLKISTMRQWEVICYIVFKLTFHFGRELFSINVKFKQCFLLGYNNYPINIIHIGVYITCHNTV